MQSKHICIALYFCTIISKKWTVVQYYVLPNDKFYVFFLVKFGNYISMITIEHNILDNKKFPWYQKSWFLLIVGCVIGFVNGFWGGGGGMICVPTLTMLIGLEEKKAHATTIFIMLPLCIASFVIYLLKGYIDWSLGGIVTAGFVVGGIIGALLLKVINSNILRIIFDVIIIAGGIRLLF